MMGYEIRDLCREEPCPLLELFGDREHKDGMMWCTWEEDSIYGTMPRGEYRLCPVCQGSSVVWILPEEPGSAG